MKILKIYQNQSLYLREKKAFLYFLNDLFTTLRQYFFKIDYWRCLKILLWNLYIWWFWKKITYSKSLLKKNINADSPNKKKKRSGKITFSCFCISFQCFQLIEISYLIYFTLTKNIVVNFQCIFLKKNLQ